MSEPKLISPLLDNFAMGDPISCHDGVRCCPALENDTGRKCIVKVISIPASQVQLDALLLTGAYDSVDAANSYFKDLSQQTEEEASVLRKLSGLEGFVSYENWQTVPMDQETGYNVYLLGDYHRTLEQHFRRNPITHLEAVNLGLDLCAALSVCRQSGYLYVDLKPENICINSNKSYRIFDLGFVRLSGLKFASLPGRYFSKYTAPEIADAFSSLNATMDIYAAGLILYQAYNAGVLPFKEDRAPSEPFTPPAYADYEMAEIILKACAPDPKDRWQDPVEMGQALVSYMQRNGANDTPIIPSASAEDPKTISDILAAAEVAAEGYIAEGEENTDNTPIDCPVSASNEEASEEADANSGQVKTETLPSSDEVLSEELHIPDDPPAAEDILSEDISSDVTDPEPEDLSAEALPETVVFEEEEEEASPAAEDPITVDTTGESSLLPVIEDSPVALNDLSEIPEESVNDETLFEDITILEDEKDDETVPDEAEADVAYDELSSDVSDILSQADELLAHPIPEPVVAPDPIDVPIPDPIVITEEPAEQEPVTDKDTDEPTIFTPSVEKTAADRFPEPQNVISDDDEDYYDDSIPAASSAKKWIITILCLLLAAGIAFFGFYYYQHYYLQPISINASGNEDSLVVYVTSSIDESKLTVICSDTYGNSLTSPVENGKAVFSSLAPGSGYTITVEVNGFYRLTGNTSTAYSTPVQTNVVQFSAIAGPEDGSVILSFAIDGPDSQQWSVRYTADGEPSKIQPFSGHMVTVVGLTIGKEYTFTLESESSVYITGNSQLVWSAGKNIKAKDLQITSCDNNKLTAVWSAPEGIMVESWSVRCYNDSGFDETIKTEDTTVVFEGIDHTKGYTVEVTAANMTVSDRTYIGANSATVTEYTATSQKPGQLILTWNTTQPLANGNWILLYSAEGMDIHEFSGTAENKAVLELLIPNVQYHFTLMTSTGSHVFNSSFDYFVEESPKFSNYNVEADKIEFNMCRRPDVENWDRFDLKPEDYKTVFAPDEKVSFLLRVRTQYNPLDENIVSMFVIRNSDGEVVKVATSQESWLNMWYRGYCELDIPVMPKEIGNYTITLYFNGYYAGQREFSIANSTAQ